MNPILAAIIGACVGSALTVYGLSWLIHAEAPSYPPEVAERLDEQWIAQKDGAEWN